MTRTLLRLAAVPALLAVRLCAQAAPPPIPWNDSGHVQYFNYQVYLSTLGFTGQTASTWGALGADARLKKINDETSGEPFLRRKFQELLLQERLSDGDVAFLKAVWGTDIADGVGKVALARSANLDPTQIKQSVNAVNALAKRLGALDVDWQAIFDGRPPPAPSSLDARLAAANYLAVRPAPAGFLDSLSSPTVTQVLATKDTFASFLRAHAVSEEAMPGLLAMYQVLSSATGDEKAQLGHILPTVVRFISDGKKVVYDPAGPKDALGLAYPGEYDRPEKVVVTPQVMGTDPLIVGKTLAHEFQHIYDMYTGRYYTLDSEMRGFKVAVLYLQTLQKTAPDKYKELVNSDNDTTRTIMRDAQEYITAYSSGPAALAQAVAYGHNYSAWSEGVFEGRVGLQQAVDPTFGAPRQLAAMLVLRDNAKGQVAALEKTQADIRAKIALTPSRDLDKQLEKVTKDLAFERGKFNGYDAQATLLQIRIGRMQSEAAWANKKAKAAGEPAPLYDLTLPVDKDYVVP